MNRSPAKALDLATLLHAAYAAEAEVEAPALAGIGLSMAKLQALKALTAAGESMPLSQLAERLACVKSNITQWSIGSKPTALSSARPIRTIAGPGSRR